MNNMKTRKQICKIIDKKRATIQKLKQELQELKKEEMLLSDEQQWYKEEKREVGRGKKKKTILEGRIYWKEDFIDEGTGNVITIERSRAVRVDGEWICF